jgi:uncharacterized peroxidase-related enzyme
MFLVNPPEDPAVQALYDEALADDGYVMNLLRAWAWRPSVHATFQEARSMLRAQSSLSEREVAVLNAATASARSDAYCSIAWGTNLAKLSDAGSAANLVAGQDVPHLTERERALARWANVVAVDPNKTTLKDVDALRAASLSEQEIFDATLLIAFRLAFTTVNSALGAQPDRQLAHEAPPELMTAITFGRPVDSGSTI